jgi:hypothetical protein
VETGIKKATLSLALTTSSLLSQICKVTRSTNPLFARERSCPSNGALIVTLQSQRRFVLLSSEESKFAI